MNILFRVKKKHYIKTEVKTYTEKKKKKENTPIIKLIYQVGT
jgi:hypothetical protein